MQTFNHTFMYMCSSIVPEHGGRGGGRIGHQPHEKAAAAAAAVAVLIIIVII